MASAAFIEALLVIEFVVQLLGKGVLSRPLSDSDRIKFVCLVVVPELDGWQSVGMNSTSTKSKLEDTANLADRLTHVKEFHKFQKDHQTGLCQFVTEIKEQLSLKYVYNWHAIIGYWGGVDPRVAEKAKYGPKIVNVVPSPGVESIGVCLVLKSIMMNKVGLVDPDKIYTFHNDLHSYLVSADVDGVKVDNQSILEALGLGFGGRVRLARKYHEALEASISGNFKNNGIIAIV